MRLRDSRGSLVLLGLVALFIASGARSAERTEAPPRARTADEQAMFEFLTTGSWCTDDCSDTTQDPLWTCRCTRIQKDGSFVETFESDVTEVAAHGDWDLILQSAASGRIRVGGTNEYIFQRHGDELWLGGLRLHHCSDEPLSTGGSASSLRPVAPPPLIDRLSAHDWVKEDDLDLYRLPMTLHFERDLNCVMRFRRGDCVQSRRFSVEGRSLIFQDQKPECGDLRGGAGNPGSSVAFVGDTLTLDGHRYLPAGSDRSVKRSPAICGNGSLCIDLSYRGELRRRVRTSLSLRFWNNAGRLVRLQSLRVSLRPLIVGSMALSGGEPEVEVADRRYPDLLLAADGSLTEVVDLIPPLRGEVVALTLTWDYTDDSGIHHSRAPLVVRIR